jgi:arabinogalactan endo-1,4-beta-galactosidase
MIRPLIAFMILLLLCCGVSQTSRPVTELKGDSAAFLFGADLSYVNQILDKGGIYKTNGFQKDPYKIFAEKGTSLARFRLWHNPVWTKEVYGEMGTQLYNDLKDVEKSISRARAEGMQLLLDFQLSDTWADPGKQTIPKAWTNITSINVLEDSVYQYTRNTLRYLNDKGLMPEYVQLGNETNCGTLYTNAPDGFPAGNGCKGQWTNLGRVFNSGIRAVREVSGASKVKTKIILHVADPKNVSWFFNELTTTSAVRDFDVIGFSYYPLWHTTVVLDDVSTKVAEFKTKFQKEVMILETAYPWTTQSNDNYGNLFSSGALPGYPFTQQGQYDFMVRLTREVKEGGGIGLIYWEPAWISSPMKDLWGTGSSWENATFFDFSGNSVKGIDYMKFKY